MGVTTALFQIEAAKESETKTMQKLEEVNREMVVKMEALKAALDRAEKAKEGDAGIFCGSPAVHEARSPRILRPLNY